MGPALPMTISRLAKTTSVAAKTIRYYEQVGVLPPPVRSTAGYRHYDGRDVERVRFVRQARVLGLPLRRLVELRACLDGPPRASMRPHLQALVAEHLSTVRRRIDELTQLRDDLEQILRRLRWNSVAPAAAGCRCLETTSKIKRSRGQRP